MAALPPQSLPVVPMPRLAGTVLRLLPGPSQLQEPTADATRSQALAPAIASRCAVPGVRVARSFAVRDETAPLAAAPQTPPERTAWSPSAASLAERNAWEPGFSAPHPPAPASWPESPSAHPLAWKCETDRPLAGSPAARAKLRRVLMHCRVENAREPSRLRTLQSNWNGSCLHPDRVLSERQGAACS